MKAAIDGSLRSSGSYKMQVNTFWLRALYGFVRARRRENILIILVWTYADVAAPRSKLSCNFSSKRMNTCAMEGDVRMHGKSGSFYVVAVSDDSYRPENGTVVLRP
jgi:hypothetical protein